LSEKNFKARTKYRVVLLVSGAYGDDNKDLTGRIVYTLEKEEGRSQTELKDFERSIYDGYIASIRQVQR
jgi:hypothetical protein